MSTANRNSSGTPRRLLGVMYLLRAVTPFVVILAVGSVGLSLINELQHTLTGPAQELSNALTEVEASVGVVQEELGSISQDLANATNALDDLLTVPDLVPEIPDSIRIPDLEIPDAVVPVPEAQVQFSSIDVAGTGIRYPSDINLTTKDHNLDIPAIPAVDVAIPGMGTLDEELANALTPITAIFSDFNAVFSGVQALKSELEQIPESATVIATQSELLVNGLQATARSWRNRLVIVLILLLLLAVNYFIIPSISDFHQGLRLLRGQPVVATESGSAQ